MTGDLEIVDAELVDDTVIQVHLRTLPRDDEPQLPIDVS